MNAAESLRIELDENCPVCKQEFIDAIVGQIRRNGYASFMLLWRIEKFHMNNGIEVPTKYEALVMGWLREEGFRVKRSRFPGPETYEVTI